MEYRRNADKNGIRNDESFLPRSRQLIVDAIINIIDIAQSYISDWRTTVHKYTDNKNEIRKRRLAMIPRRTIREASRLQLDKAADSFGARD